ncbi:DUF2599 domain-containing protein [Luteibacter flocculans]|uniref:DUF2599 domain-containing protein n=1 Tax=Luteibacter flocculans TaxID=2780091 RepID=A0ABY4T4R0_9GAMM|nr:DUF2599 domain-containing protein [Luteibacter flocculans]URL58882.1 DUF2599 domain-containing protein [Luteibacter flocculans]
MDTRMRRVVVGLLVLVAGLAGGALLNELLFARGERLAAAAPREGSCSSYVNTAESRWFVDQWGETSLRIVPTACGRRIGPSDTPHMFYEIVKLYGDPEQFGSGPRPSDRWKNVKGMINQLTCHLRIARDKDEWNLEPYRPWVGDDATDNAGCNPYIPGKAGDPATAKHAGEGASGT